MAPEKKAPNGENNPPVETTKSKWYQYPGVNLRFLLDFMRATGHNTASLCKMSNMPPQALRVQLKRDDMKISKAKELIKNAGYKLDIKLYMQSQEADSDYIVTLPKAIRKNDDKNLAFLDEFFSMVGESQYEIGKKMGITQGAVFSWFKTDDIMISYIVKIKEIYKAKLEFRITEKI